MRRGTTAAHGAAAGHWPAPLWFVSLSIVLLAGCGRYAEFALPVSEVARLEVTPRWEVLPDPVLPRGAAGQWDSVDALNPSVVPFQGQWLNVYSGYDGRQWRTGTAWSQDGFVWQKAGAFLTPNAGSWEGDYIAANGAALVRNGEVLYWYQAGSPPRLGLAQSRDGKAWTRHPEPVLPLGPRGSWDERAVADPYVIEREGVLYLYYLGEDRARRQRLGVARSRDGLVWEKHRRNPILDVGEEGAFDENGLGEPAVWSARGRYWMLYTGRDRHEGRRMGLAHSIDGVGWRRYRESPVLSGDRDWNRRVVCDATVEPVDGRWRVWFGGGDVAHPAENIHGQIGHAWLSLDVEGR